MERPRTHGPSLCDEVYIFALDGGKLATATGIVEDNLTRMRQLGLGPFE